METLFDRGRCDTFFTPPFVHMFTVRAVYSASVQRFLGIQALKTEFLGIFAPEQQRVDGARTPPIHAPSVTQESVHTPKRM